MASRPTGGDESVGHFDSYVASLMLKHLNMVKLI